MKNIDLSKHIIRQEISSRGGGIEISLSFIKKYKGHRMTAYQNYLGGGLLGSVQSDCSYPNWKDNKTLISISDRLKKYFHELTNPESEWESMSYEQNQNMPISAY